MRSALDAAFILSISSERHVSPILIDVIKAGLTGVRLVDARPADRDFNEVGPKGILALVINQHDIGAVLVFKWIGHSWDLSFRLVLEAYTVSRVQLRAPDLFGLSDRAESCPGGDRRFGEL